MTTSSESKLEIPTVEEVETWNNKKMLRWIQKRNRNILKHDNLEKFKKAYIIGRSFLHSDVDFYKTCGLPPGVGLALKILADEVKGKGKLSNQTAGRKRKKDEIDPPEPSISPKRHRRECQLSQLATRANEQRKLVREMITDLNSSSNQHSNSVDPLPGAVAQLSNPKIVHTLPFPFVGSEVPVRFKLDNEAKEGSEAEVDNEAEVYWPYAGRTMFETLVKKLKKVQKSLQLTTVWLYGTQGYGKSHLLAALVCYLAARGERVVYIPDCRAMLKNPVEYFRAAMLFAWANDNPTQREIMTLDTQKEIEDFFSSTEGVIFVIDQMNALKTSNTSTEAKKRTVLYNWIQRFMAGHKSVFSSSANYDEYHDQKREQTSNLVVRAYGGLDRMEMHEWWNRHSDIDMGCYERSDVEDVTGCIPLLLDKCLVSGKVDLTVVALREIYDKAVCFVQQMRSKRKGDPLKWSWYCEYVMACIHRKRVPSGYSDYFDLIDHRYFFRQKGWKGNYACGLVRDAVADQLLEEGVNSADTDWLTSLPDFIKNKSITGFFIEHAVLSAIRQNGLAIGKSLGKSMQVKRLKGPGDLITAVTGKPVLYRPEICNFPAIDAMIVLIKPKEKKGDKPKLLMVPIQITVNRPGHADSHAAFVNDYTKWTKTLSGFDVELEFVWITPEEDSVKEHKAKSKSKCPEHNERYIPFKRVSEEIWRQYQNALKFAG